MTKFATAACVALLGCRGGDAELVRRTLPGFSIELPKGVETRAELAYDAGKLRIERIGGGAGMLAAYWNFGKVVERAALLELARATARQAGLDPQQARLLEREPGEPPIMAIDAARTKLQSFAQCGARAISIATFEVEERVHRKIIESFRCAPDPARETSRVTIPFAIDLPGFEAFQRSPSLVALASETATVILRRSEAALDVERDSATIFKMLSVDARAEPRRGNVIPFVASVEGRPAIGVLRHIACAGGAMLVIAYADDEASAKDLEQRVDAARCLAAGESPPTWADAPPL